MGAVVSAYRHHPAHGRRPLPQALVSRWLDVSQGQLSRIETGQNQVRDLDRLIHYARRLRIPPEFLWFNTDEDDAGNGLRVTASPAAGGLPLNALPAQQDHEVLVDSLLRTLDEYIRIDNIASGKSLIAVVPQHIAFIEDLLNHASERSRSRLLYVAGRFTEFSGWLYQDAGDLVRAMGMTDAAMDFAREACDPAQIAYVLMRKSNIASDARKPNLALDLALAARRTPALPDQLQATILRQEAHGHALAGSDNACARAVDEAFKSASRALDHGGPDITQYCTPSYIDMEAAGCWTELNQPRRAIKAIEQGLRRWPPAFQRDLGLCLARLAHAYACDDEPEQALVTAQQSLAIAHTNGSGRTTRQLRRVEQAMAAAGAPRHAHQLNRALTTVR